MRASPSVLLITGYGLNCEAESQVAWERAGARVTRMHLKDLIAQPACLMEHEALMFIGGFSFGDHMGSGHVFAARVRHHLQEGLQRFIDDDRLVLGVCNGFQVMVRLGLIPAVAGDFFSPRVALIRNDCAAFQNRWVRLRFEPNSNCVFTKGLDTVDLPIRHGEGKLFAPSLSTLDDLESEGCVACRYVDPTTGEPTASFPANPNGSARAIAGLCDPSGRLLGMMPHPEAYLFRENHPAWAHADEESLQPTGQVLFDNAVAYLR